MRVGGMIEGVRENRDESKRGCVCVRERRTGVRAGGMIEGVRENKDESERGCVCKREENK